LIEPRAIHLGDHDGRDRDAALGALLKDGALKETRRRPSKANGCRSMAIAPIASFVLNSEDDNDPITHST
jgi:hypothetical protein